MQVYTQIVKANRTGVIAVDPFEKLCDLGGWQSYDAARRYICDAVDCRRDIQAAIYPALSAYLGGVIYLSVRQVAEILNISARSVNRQIKRGLLPASKVGGRVRVYCDDVYLFAKRMRIVRKEKL